LADFTILTNFSNIYSIGSGITFEHFNYDPKIFGEIIPDVQNDNYFSYHGFLLIDTFDKTIYPSKGFQLELRSKRITDHFLNGIESKQQSINLTTLKVHSIVSVSNKTIISNRFYSGFTKAEMVPFLYNHFLGGTRENIGNTIPFNGLKFMELFDTNIFTYQIKIRNEIWSNNYLSIALDVGNAAPNFDELFSFNDTMYGYSISYSLNTPLGQMEFHLSKNDNNKGIIPFISVGYLF
jgi:NTE family protein